MADPSVRSESLDSTPCSNMPLPPARNPDDHQVAEQVPPVPDPPSAPPLPTANQDDIAPSLPPLEQAVIEPVIQPNMEPTPAPTTQKVSITLLLVSGRRRTVEFDPKTSIGELKEVIWSTWPSDWSDELPPSASFLRILYLGRILTDETSLTSLNLPAPPESTVVHVSVRSFAPTSSDEDVKKKPKKRARRGRSMGTDSNTGGDGVRGGDDPESDTSGGCCGCIIC